MVQANQLDAENAWRGDCQKPAGNSKSWLGANFLENHDQPRSLSKYIREPQYRNAIGAKALALLYFGLRGCPFIYQGQELGMVNAVRTNIDQFNDLSAHDNYRRALAEGYSEDVALTCVNRRSRDNARTPYPWDDSQKWRLQRWS